MVLSGYSKVAEALGWTMVHSLWQIALVSLFLGIFLYVFRYHSARLKYILACMGMIVSVMWVGHTLVDFWPREIDSESTPVRMDMEMPGSHVQMPTPTVDPINITHRIRSMGIAVYHLLARNTGILGSIWCTGAIAFSLWMMGGYWYSRSTWYRKKQHPPAFVKTGLETLAKRMNIRKRIRIYVSPNATVPFLMGALKPVILMPAALITGLPANQIEAILAHELAHVKRFDYLSNLMQSIVEALLFYHPAIWWMSAIMRREREHACDDMALSVCDEKLTYIKALSSIQNINHKNTKAMVAISDKKSRLLARMRRLVNRDYDRPNTLILPLILALPLVGFLALKPVPQALQQKSIPPVETAAQEDMHIAAMMPPVLTENGPRSMGIPADTIKTRKEKKSVRKHQEKSDIDTLEEAFDWDAEFDMDFDFEFPEIEFTDSLDLHFQFMGAHLDEAFNHLEFDFPHVHMHDSFSTIWKDVRIDIEEAFKDLEHEFPRMDFTDTNWIDKEELRKNMDALRKEMKKFRSDEFQEEMKKARLEMQRSMDQLREEMKRFKEEEWPKIREEIRKTIEEDQKHKSTRTDSLKIRTTGAHAI